MKGPQRPLTGVRALEMGSRVAAPYVGKLLADAGADVRKVESPAGEGIAFSRGLGRDSEIFVMHADGSEVRQLTDNDYWDGWPAWSPTANSSPSKVTATGAASRPEVTRSS